MGCTDEEMAVMWGRPFAIPHSFNVLHGTCLTPASAALRIEALLGGDG